MTIFLSILCIAFGLFGVIQFFQAQQFKSLSTKLKAQVKKIDAKASALERKYRPIIDREARLQEIQTNINAEENNLSNLKSKFQKEESNLNEKLNILKSALSPLEEQSLLISFGFYESQYDFNESIQYQNRLDVIKQKQKELIKNFQAVACNTEWSLGDSKSEGKKMIKNISKLILRAFNGECDSCITKVKYSNIKVMENRIKNAFEALNKLGSVINAYITNDFLNLKLEELYLVHEYREKQQEEKEEQKLIREQMKEEQKAQKQLEQALKEAEREEEIYKKALEKAMQTLETDNTQSDSLLKKIESLKEKLHEAESNRERAISQAQLTKSGYVYVISNVGSFGDSIYKIGMTRRLEPMDRVKELSSASVPFPFDIHAMIYCEDAPEMESNLHKHFSKKRVNKANIRKEFFNVSLEDIKKAVQEIDKELHLCKSEIKFTKVAEAEEYRKTLSAANLE